MCVPDHQAGRGRTKINPFPYVGVSPTSLVVGDTHMGAAKISAKGAIKSVRKGDYKKRPREGDCF